MKADHSEGEVEVQLDLLYRIPVNAKRILEVGCKNGDLGREFKRINPNTKYLGIEPNKEWAAEARKKIDNVIEEDLDNLRLDKIKIKRNSIDCLILNNTILDLNHPERELVLLLTLLADSGVVLISIKNKRHWKLIADLLGSELTTQKDRINILNEQHRMTKEELIDLVCAVGLRVQSVTPRIIDPELTARFCEAMEPSIKNLEISMQDFLNGTAPEEYILKASKKPVSSLQISGLMLKPQAGMTDVRMIQPLRSVASIAGITVELSSDGLSLSSTKDERPKIMIWQRQLLTYENSLEQLRNAIRAGYVLVSEFDDDPEHWPAIGVNKNLNFTGMHAVQTSTVALAKKLKKINPNVAVFENCLEKLPNVDPEKWKDVGKCKRIKLFFGALNRQNSWKEWIEPLNKVLLQQPNSWEVEVVHDKDFFNAVRSENKNFTPTCNYTKYMEILKSCHVSLLPLERTDFNKMKSDLKFVESAGTKVLTIASPTVYENSISHQKTGIICSKGEDLIAILEEIATNPEKAEQIAASALVWCKNNRLQYAQTQRRIEWYMSIWQNRDKLTKELLIRVPELAS